MEFNFDRDGIYYIGKFAAIAALIFFAGSLSARELENYYFAFETANLLSAVPKANLVSRPVFKELAKENSVFMPAETVLTKLEELKNTMATFIFADLNKMTLSYYKNGEFFESFKISAKGKEESFFETPSGFYKINYKEQNHFSTIGKVWMPWSMHIFGNYFIHGWPYYPGGKPVAQTFSGGCIRLSAEDAKELFKITEQGTPVLICSEAPRNGEFFAAPRSYFKKIAYGRSSKEPFFSASSVLAADFETGQILFSKNDKVPHPIASLTKLMTALVASEIYHGRVFRITRKALEEYGRYGGLQEGEIFETGELLYPLLLASDNDAAAALELASNGFVSSMNDKARATGLSATRFADASGLDLQNTSTAEDMFKLLKYIFNYKKPIFDILGLKEYKLVSKNKKIAHTWKNINWPLGDKRFMAGKIGHTDEALETMAGVYKIKLSEGEPRAVAIVVLHSSDRQKDANKLIKHLEENFVYGNVLVKKRAPAMPEERSKVVFNEANIYEAIKILGY